MSMRDGKVITRRRFMQTAATTAASFTIVKTSQVRGTEANSRIKVGCIGLGGRGSMIGRFFKDHGGYEVHALCDYFPEVVGQAGEQFSVGKQRCFSGLLGYKRLIECGVDAVVLETPPYCFPAHATAAVEAGCHVYIAKPIAVDVPGTMQIRKAGRQATQRKKVFLVDFQMRVNPYLIECIKRLRDGVLGEVNFIRSYYDDEGYRDPAMEKTIANRLRYLIWANDIELGGGKMVNSGIHAIDAAVWIANRVPVSASGSASIVRPNPHGNSKDIYSVTYRFDDDRLIMNHTGEHFKNLNSRIAHCDAYGQYGYMEARYSEKNWIRSNKGGYIGGDKPDIYRWGAQENIRVFHKNITEGIYDNQTVEPSVSANLTAILGREAAANNTTVTMSQVIRENKKLEPDLSGLES